MPPLLSSTALPVQLIRASGFSMEPLIRDQDELVVRLGAKVRAGDIALYRGEKYSAPVAHRVVHADIENRRLLFQSDAYPLNREWVMNDQVIGKIVLCRRQGCVIYDAGSPWASLTDRFWTFTSVGRFKLREMCALYFEWAISRIQQMPFYRSIAFPKACLEVQMGKMGENFFRFTAKLNGCFAGSADAEFKIHHAARICWISGLAVRIRYRRMGVANRILREITQYAEDNCELILTAVHHKNRAAQELFKSLGFIKKEDAAGFAIPGHQTLGKSIRSFSSAH